MKSTKDLYIATQEAKLATGGISRRRFISNMLAAGIVLPTAMGMASRAMAQASRGGTFKMGRGHGATTDTLDPATFENGFQTALGFAIGNCLTEIAANGELVGELAESWEASPDAKTWRFKLRSGVEFHNGKSLTPEDVIATLDYHRSEDSKSAAKGNLATVDTISADGDTVVFQLTGGNADFPYLVSDYHFIILPSVDGKPDVTSGIGTGGYVLENFEPGVRVSGTRFANYWKEGAAWFDSYEMLSIIDNTARQTALLNGSVDAIDRLDPKTANLMSRAPNIDILERTGSLHYTFPMRVTSAPFDNYDLRMALKLSVKRQELVDKILLGYGSVGNDTPISSSTPYYAELPQREFDPDKARFHYEKSGHSGPIQLSSSDAAFAGAVDAAQLIAASAAEAGINVEVVREPSDGYWSNVWNKKGWCACYWNGRPTPDWMFSSAYTADTEWNDTDWRTTDAAVRFNEVVTMARSELDDAKRGELYKEAQMLIHDDGGALVPMFANYVAGTSKKIAHSEDVAANLEMDGNKCIERWWMA